MPGLNGLHLFYEIRILSPNTKIMFISALDITEDLVSILPGVNVDFVKNLLHDRYFVVEVVFYYYFSEFPFSVHPRYKNKG